MVTGLAPEPTWQTSILYCTIHRQQSLIIVRKIFLRVSKRDQCREMPIAAVNRLRRVSSHIVSLGDTQQWEMHVCCTITIASSSNTATKQASNTSSHADSTSSAAARSTCRSVCSRLAVDNVAAPRVHLSPGRQGHRDAPARCKVHQSGQWLQCKEARYEMSRRRHGRGRGGR